MNTNEKASLKTVFVGALFFNIVVISFIQNILMLAKRITLHHINKEQSPAPDKIWTSQTKKTPPANIQKIETITVKSNSLKRELCEIKHSETKTQWNQAV